MAAVTRFERGYFSLLRWRSDATRDEARNVAVVLVDAEGAFGGVKPVASLYSVSPNLRDQGILDGLMTRWQRRFDGDAKPDLAEIREMHATMTGSLYLTEPRPCAVTDFNSTLDILYKAHVARRGFGGGHTKGKVLEQVVRWLRRAQFEVDRDEYVGDFVFDAVVKNVHEPLAINVLSFAQQGRKDWRDSEWDAGHFLFGLESAALPGIAVVESPVETSAREAEVAFERVSRWYASADIRMVSPEDLAARPDLITDRALALR